MFTQELIVGTFRAIVVTPAEKTTSYATCLWKGYAGVQCAQTVFHERQHSIVLATSLYESKLHPCSSSGRRDSETGSRMGFWLDKDMSFETGDIQHIVSQDQVCLTYRR